MGGLELKLSAIGITIFSRIAGNVENGAMIAIAQFGNCLTNDKNVTIAPSKISIQG